MRLLLRIDVPMFRRSFTQSFLRACVLSALVLLVVACGSTPDKEDAKPRELQKFERKVDFRQQWSRGVGDGQGKHYARLQIGYSEAERRDSDLAVASVSGRIERISQAGKRVWRTRLKQGITAGVGVGNGIAVVANDSAEIVAVGWDNGEELWRVGVNGEVLAAPQVSSGITVVQTSDGRLLGLSAEDGSRLRPNASSSPAISCTPLKPRAQPCWIC